MICARPGCERTLPRLAELAGDPYCSTTCCRVALGLEPSKPQEYARTIAGCKGCGGPMDELTPGCKPCELRQRKRELRRMEMQAAWQAA